MGYGLQGYSVKISDLENNFNSWPERVYEQVSGNNKRELDNLNNNFNFEIDDLKCPDAYKSLEEIISRNYTFKGNGFIYCYVFELICREYAEQLNNSELYPLGSVQQVFFLGEWEKVPFGMSDTHDYPIIYIIVKEDFDKVISKMQESKLEDEGKLQLKSWIENAKSKENDLILFYY